jgi:putative ABC transport system permease protein
MANPILTTAVSVGFETLRANPLRTLLSTLGIVMGVAALTSVLSIGDGVERYARQQVEQRTDAQRLTLLPYGGRGGGGGRGFAVRRQQLAAEPLVFTRADVDSLAHVLTSDATVNLTISGSAVITTRRDPAPHPVQVTGMLFAEGALADSMLGDGRAFTPMEGSSGAPVVVISNGLATDLAHGHDVHAMLGDTLLVQGAPRQVIGVLKADTAERGRRALMPAGAVVAVPTAYGTGQLTTINIKARRIEDVPIVQQQTELWLTTRYGADWKTKVTIGSAQATLDTIGQFLLVFKIFMSALMGISLLVGGIGIMNVLLASVIERTREIGIRKAVGAQQRHILWQFLAESVTITGVGSLIGLTLGVLGAVLITFIMRRMANAPIHAWLSMSTVLTAVGASVLIGVVFGLYPALRAARLAPIEAMRHE